MSHINLEFAVGRRFAVAACSALLCVVGLLAPGASSASAANFTCRASALRVTALSLVNAEPTIANAPNDPCQTQSNTLVSVPAPLNMLLNVSAVNAATSASAASASATGGVVSNLSVPTLGISASVATSNADAMCTAGAPSFTSSSKIVGLTVAGMPVTQSGAYNLPALILPGGVANVTLSQTTTTASGITQRAVDITIAGGLNNGVHIVLGEASVGANGNPCSTGDGGGGGGGGGSVTSPPTNVSPPVISGNPQPGHRLRCSTGRFTGNPTRYSYQWYLAGRPIAGANGSSYVVKIGDEASSPSDKLTCAVIAYNDAGASAPARSRGVLVAVPGTLHCARPTGQLNGTQLGVLGLGMTQHAARSRLRRFQVTQNRFDNFCLYAGWGIRVAYPSSALLAKANAGRSMSGRIVIALTANPYYALNGTRPGAKLTKGLQGRLRLGKPFHIGRNYWYVVPGGGSRGLIKVRGGVIQEIGIISRQLSNSRTAQSRLLRSFPNAF